MKILLIGASGMVGSRILAEAVSRGHQVKAAARNPAKVAKGSGVEAIALDANNADAIAAAASDVDVIVSATSPRSGGDPVAEALGVGKALVAAAGKTGTRVFVVGGAGSLSLPDGTPLAETLPDAYRGEALGMRGVRDLLKASALDWTVLSPAAVIAPGERTGVYRLGSTTLMSDDKGESRISAEDFAKAVIDELESPDHSRQHFSVAY